jgi:hypothetical protein
MGPQWSKKAPNEGARGAQRAPKQEGKGAQWALNELAYDVVICRV